MKKKYIKITWFVFFFAFSFISCTSPAKKEQGDDNKSFSENPSKQIFRMNLHSEPSCLDPRQVRDIPTITTGKMFFDGLTRMNSESKLEPSVAKKIVISDDQLIYEFSLKDTIWSNGKPVTAYDFEYAWKKVLSPDFPSEYAHQLFVIKNAKAVKKGLLAASSLGIYSKDAKTLVVELEHPYPFFLQLTSFPICFPIPSEIESQNSQWASCQGKDFICNGPFRLVKWNQGNELVAEKNPFYWDFNAVNLDTIILTLIEDEHTELNMYENGELDWAGSPNSSIPPEALPSLKKNLREEDQLIIQPIAGTYCYKFNTKMAPFQSVKMRKAFALAINRRSLIDNILQANQLVATSLLPPCLAQTIKGDLPKRPVYFKDADRQKAQELFEEALVELGLTRDTLPSITLIFSKSEKHQKIAQAVQQEWSNAFDIKINLQSYEWNTYIDHLSKHNYQVGGRGWVSDISDPKSLLEIYKFSNDESGSGGNDTQWENPEFTRLIDEATVCKNEKQRQSLLEEAEKILIAEMPITPLFHSTACYLKKAYVKGVYMSELCDLDLKHAYIER